MNGGACARLFPELHYMQMNPLKRKLVDHPKDWPWSSFSFYLRCKQSLVPIDPGN